MAASGKSTFATVHSTYNGYEIVDFAERLPEMTFWTRVVMYISRFIKPARKIASGRPDRAARKQENYFASAFQFMTEHDGPLVVFGRRTPDDFEELPVHGTVRFSMVLIPEEQHRRQCESRKKQMRNPLPFFHHWTTDFEKISRIRSNLLDYARKHDITVYDSFSAAIDDMHERYAARR